MNKQYVEYVLAYALPSACNNSLKFNQRKRYCEIINALISTWRSYLFTCKRSGSAFREKKKNERKRVKNKIKIIIFIMDWSLIWSSLSCAGKSCVCFYFKHFSWRFVFNQKKIFFFYEKTRNITSLVLKI